MDDFEKYIKEHASLFDEEKANTDKIWQHIEAELEEPKTIYLWNLSGIKIAATILVLVGVFSMSSLLISTMLDQNQEQNIVHQELNDIDTYYSNLVSFQVQLVKDNPKLHAEDKEKFLSFMDELDEEYLLLKSK